MKDLLSERLAAPPPAAVERSADAVLSGRRAVDMKSLSERIERLNLSMQAARLKLDAQRAKLDGLRAGIEGLTGGLQALTHGAETLAQELAAAPAPAPAPVPVEAPRSHRAPGALSPIAAAAAAPAPAARPRIVLPAVEEESRLRSRPDVVFYPESAGSFWLKPLAFLPYAAIAALGLTLSCTGPIHHWAKLPSWRLRQQPPDVSAAIAAQDAPTPEDNESAAPDLPMPDPAAADDAALALVYGYHAPGAAGSVRQVLSPEIESAAESDPDAWVVEPADDGGSAYLVSFRPYGDALDSAPIYEFQVDLRSKAVTASAATVAALQGVTLAAR